MTNTPWHASLKMYQLAIIQSLGP